jgi:hypothetical protein
MFSNYNYKYTQRLLQHYLAVFFEHLSEWTVSKEQSINILREDHPAFNKLQIQDNAITIWYNPNGNSCSYKLAGNPEKNVGLPPPQIFLANEKISLSGEIDLSLNQILDNLYDSFVNPEGISSNPPLQLTDNTDVLSCAVEHPKWHTSIPARPHQFHAHISKPNYEEFTPTDIESLFDRLSKIRDINGKALISEEEAQFIIKEYKEQYAKLTPHNSFSHSTFISVFVKCIFLESFIILIQEIHPHLYKEYKNYLVLILKSIIFILRNGVNILDVCQKIVAGNWADTKSFFQFFGITLDMVGIFDLSIPLIDKKMKDIFNFVYTIIVFGFLLLSGNYFVVLQYYLPAMSAQLLAKMMIKPIVKNGVKYFFPSKKHD